ncbi:MAG: hypothetical protein P4L40_22730, partial [Terracidiphilus sp.]|nr:hypothetical protein [Terracidiphilus sp.]
MRACLPLQSEEEVPSFGLASSFLPPDVPSLTSPSYEPTVARLWKPQRPVGKFTFSSGHKTPPRRPSRHTQPHTPHRARPLLTQSFVPAPSAPSSPVLSSASLSVGVGELQLATDDVDVALAPSPAPLPLSRPQPHPHFQRLLFAPPPAPPSPTHALTL